MDYEEGALFLLRRAGIIAKDAQLIAAPEQDRSAAVEISKELGGLPLALDQAGAFVEETPSTLSEYLKLFQMKRHELLDKGSQFTSHPSVTATFSLAFSKVEQVNPAASEVIRLCSFLAPDAIAEEILTEGAPDLGGACPAFS